MPNQYSNVKNLMKMASSDVATPGINADNVVPGGASAAIVFPWWAGGVANLPNGTAIGDINNVDFSWTGPAGFAALAQPAKNNLSRDILIKQIKFWGPTTDLFLGEEVAATDFLMVKIQNGSNQLVDKWLPVQAMNTVHTQNSTGMLSQNAIKLPAKYYLQHGHVFAMSFRSRSAAFFGKEFDVAIRGHDPINDTPVVMIKTGTFGASAAVTTTLIFDENRASALRDVEITDIEFSWTEVDGSTSPAPIGYEALIDIRFNVPTGPKWTDAGWLSLAGLLTTIGCRSDNPGGATPYYHPMVTYEPPSPLLFRSTEELRVSTKSMAAIKTRASGMYCWLIGTQEG